MTKKASTISVYGKVQGVGFRYHTHKKAQEFNIVGFVKNKPDGSVYIEAQGDEIDLATFIDWCKVGPSWSRVINTKTQTIPLFNTIGFHIK